MPKLISESVRQHVIKIATQQGFVAQLKDNGEDQYVKNLMFYSKPLNQFIYIRKDRAVGAGGVPAYFQVALHPDFFNKSWAASSDGIQEHINRQKKKNLHSSSYYQKFPVFSENNEPCGMCFKAADFDALERLFQRMASGKVFASEQYIEPLSQHATQKTDQSKVALAADSYSIPEVEAELTSKIKVEAINGIPTKGLIIKSPYIDRILAGTKTWEMRSSSTSQRGPIALIKQGTGQIVGVANLVGVKGPLSEQDKMNNIDQHQISEERLQSGDTEKWNVAWILESAQPLETPVNYQHPNGAVIWVNLEPQVQAKLALAIA
ncbi:ASCH domain-containing protein [Methylobacter sp. G7]|uniref:ASCH domain-containing protein n=1 Tax=Methylobacter sp. G7 TaxID=3230117 RepID=UPI003D804876